MWRWRRLDRAARGTRLLPFPMSDVARGRLRLRRVSPRNWFYDFAFAMRTGQEHIVNHCVAQPFQGSAPTPWGELIDLLNFGAKLPNERWNGLYASEVRTGGDAGHPGLTQDGDEAVRLRYTSTTQGTLPRRSLSTAPWSPRDHGEGGGWWASRDGCWAATSVASTWVARRKTRFPVTR